MQHERLKIWHKYRTSTDTIKRRLNLSKSFQEEVSVSDSVSSDITYVAIIKMGEQNT